MTPPSPKKRKLARDGAISEIMNGSQGTFALFLKLLLCSCLRGTNTQDVRVTFMGTEIPDHAVIRLGYIRVDMNDNVHCVTNNTDCCTNNQEAGWYYPNGTQLSTNESGVAFYSTKGQGEVRLNRKPGQGSPEDAGIYHCELPDANGVTQFRYVGIYNRPSGFGQPFVNSSITFNLTSAVPPSFSLGCISTSGPPTVVTWTRDGIPLPMDSNHVLAQTLVNSVTATYHNNLTVNGILPGLYRCTVTSIKPVIGDRLNASQEVDIDAAGSPTNLLAMQASPTSIRVSWTAPVSGATVTGYQINYQSEREEGSVDVGASEATVTLDGRSHGLTYNITVVALSQQLPSPVVGPVIITLAPSAPSIITAVSLSPTSITLTWTQPVGEVVDSYEVSFSYQGPCSGFNHTNTTTVNGTTRQYTLTGLQEFSNYTVTITAVNTALQAEAMATITLNTTATIPSSTPQRVISLTLNSTAISVSWDPVDCIHQNSEITGYIVHYGPASSSTRLTSEVLGTTSTERAYTAVGLVPSTNYSIQVAAVNREGNVGPFTAAIFATTVVDVTLFQLRLSGVHNCGEWQLRDLQNKLADVTTTVQENAENICQCGFSLQHISDSAFECFLNPDEVTFRARLQGTAQASSSQLVNYIEQWSTRDVTIAVQGLRLRVDSSCSIAISSFSDPECETERQQPTSDSNLPAIIGGAVAGVVALIVTVLGVGLVVIIIKRRSATIHFKRKKQPIKWSEVAETDESHISTKESAAYVKTAPQQVEGAFDYEMPMTQCAAYETRPTDPLYDFVN